ncbi:hypothetical protein ACS0TY_009701 [Phlomoides rotata]
MGQLLLYCRDCHSGPLFFLDRWRLARSPSPRPGLRSFVIFLVIKTSISGSRIVSRLCAGIFNGLLLPLNTSVLIKDYELNGIDWKKVDFEDNQESPNLFEKDAQGAVNDLTGKWLGSRKIRCNWATKGTGTSDGKQGSDSKSVVELINGSSEDVKEAANSDVPENNPQYTTVYVGNLAPEIDLHHHFHTLGVGSIEEVRVQRDKGFGFVRYSTRAEAAMDIQLGNTQSYLCGKPIKGQQHHLKQPSMGMGAGASHAIYDGGYQSMAAAQQLMYYQ